MAPRKVQPLTLLVDTGVLLATADERDPDHNRSTALMREHVGQLLTTVPVLIETGWSVESRLGAAAEVRLYRMVTTRELEIEPLDDTDWVRIAELTEKYADFPLGGVDASLVAVAERLKLDTIATLDHRHFRAVRPNHVGAFNLLPG